MSYDLYFTVKQSPPAAEDFENYFENRGKYEVSEAQAFYQNEDTGVYFTFDYGETGQADDEEADSLSFNMNYFRPHYFGLEAAPEVMAFIEAFDLDVIDPQGDETTNGAFSLDDFLNSWNAGNRFAYRAILSSADGEELFVAPTEEYVYPAEELEKIWQWNFGREDLQRQVGETRFVPKIMFLKNGEHPASAVVWPDACPIYLPKTDLLILVRHDLASQPLSADDHPELTIVKWQRLAPLLNAFPQGEDPLTFYKLEYDEPPAELREFVKSQPLVPLKEGMAINNSNVHDAETVEEAMGADI